MSYCKDWVDGIWLRNGIPTLSEPAFLIYHEDPEANVPISMSSMGVIQVKVLWKGIGSPPSQLRLAVTSTARAMSSDTDPVHIPGSGSNGLGSKFVFDMSYPMCAASDGTHIRVVDTSSGTGILTLQAAAAVSLFGPGKGVWTEIGEVHAAIDDRYVWPVVPEFTQKSVILHGRKHQFQRNYNGINFSHVTDFYEASLELCEVTYSNSHTCGWSAPMGLQMTEETHQSSHAHGAPAISDIDLLCGNIWPGSPNPIGEPCGTFQWQGVNLSPQFPKSGTNLSPGNLHNQGTTVVHPLKCSPWAIWAWKPLPMLVFPGDVGDTREVKYSVDWSDGVSGEASVEYTLHHKGEVQEVRSIVALYDEALPKFAFNLAESTSTLPGGWVWDSNGDVLCENPVVPSYIHSLVRNGATASFIGTGLSFAALEVPMLSAAVEYLEGVTPPAGSVIWSAFKYAPN
ncbi:hypothetical protein QPK87_05185 [Kamptonema cortianum]|nr:hypothetical protein [Geitlerinema splendidum]MDK3155970.1 hypothetical protein [Kamptonema cortianum]